MHALHISRHSLASATFALFCGLGAPPAVEAATATGVAGIWGVQLDTKFSVNGYGQRQFKDSGDCEIAQQGSLNAAFACVGFNQPGTQDYGGGITTVIRRDKLGWALDAAGQAQVEKNLTALLTTRAEKRGYTLAPGGVTLSFDKFDYRPIKLSKSLSEPQVAKGILKGRAVQLINGRYVVQPFNYNLKISFLARVR